MILRPEEVPWRPCKGHDCGKPILTGTYPCFIVVVVSLLVLSVGALLPQVQATTWDAPITIDSAGDVGIDDTLVLDANGTPHICYYNYTSPWSLKYARRVDGVWQNETIGPSGEWYSCLALDAKGNPHVSYHDVTYFDLMHAYKSSGTWHFETVDSAEKVGYNPSITIDSHSNPRISYYEQQGVFSGSGNLKFAAYNTSGWNITTVDTIGDVGKESSLALDANGNPHISYLDISVMSDGNLKYAFYNGSGWNSDTVDSDGDVGWDPSLALDANGNPHISYYEWTNADNLKYGFHNASGWHIETIDREGSVGAGNSLALDANGNPHISYYDWTNRALKYAFHNATGWHIETIAAAGTVGGYTSLALDTSGNPRISYYTGSSAGGDLKYIEGHAEPAFGSSTFRSAAGQDGWVLESGETTDKGSTLNASAPTFNLGDNARDRQYRSVLSFNTSSLPDEAVITSATLKIRRKGLTGTTPFATHGNIRVDIRKGPFGSTPALQAGDFQAAASKANIGTIINKSTTTQWYSATLTKDAYAYINTKGVTQVRLRFVKDDNDDTDADYLQFYSGNTGTISNRPKLQVIYNAP